MDLIQDIPLPIPAIKIKKIDAEIRDLTFDIIPDKVIIQGKIHKQVFFVGIDNIVHHITDDMPFSTFVDVNGAKPGMSAQIDIDIEKIIPHLNPEGTIIKQKAILEIFVKVKQEQVVSLRPAATGPLIELKQVIGSGKLQETLPPNEVTLEPPAAKIDEIRPDVEFLEPIVEANQVIIFGVIFKQIFYVSQEGNLVHQEEVIPFDRVINVQGAEPGMEVDIKADVNIASNLSEDGTNLTQDIFLEITAIVTEIVQRNIATGFDLLTKIPKVIGENIKQFSQINNVTLEQPAEKVLRIIGEITDTKTRIIEDKVIIQGTINKTILYLGFDGQEHTQTEGVKFSNFVEVPGAQPGQTVRSTVTIEGDIGYQLLADNQTVRQDVVLEAFVKVKEIVQLQLDQNEPGIQALLPVVIWENQKQILVEQEVPPPIIAGKKVVTIVEREAVTARKQVLIENFVELPCQAIKVVDKRTTAEIVDVVAELIFDDLVRVTGTVIKNITFVCADNVVRHLEEKINFQIDIPLSEPLGPGELTDGVEIIIEKIINRLIDNGNRIDEKIILEARIDNGISRVIRDVVTDLTGPGVITEKLTVQAEILNEGIQIFDVVVSVTDPNNVSPGLTRQILNLYVVDEGRVRPVEVYIDP